MTANPANDGGNHSIHVPEDKVAEMEQASESGRHLREHILELSATDAAEIVYTASSLKNSRKSHSKTRPKINSLLNRAAKTGSPLNHAAKTGSPLNHSA